MPVATPLTRSATLGITDTSDLGETPYSTFLSSVNSLGRNASPSEIVQYMRGRTPTATEEEKAARGATSAEARRQGRKSSREAGVLTRAGQAIPLPPIDTSQDPQDLTIAGLQGMNTSIQQEADARRIIMGRALTAQEDLSKLGDLNREEYKRDQRRKTNPTEGIDQDILDIRNKALVGRAALMEQVRTLPFEMQNRLIAQHGGMFGRALQKLMDLRQMKLDAIDAQSDEKFDSYQEQVRTHKAKIDGLKTALDFMEAQGESNEAMAQIRLDLAKELERLNKRRGEGLTSNEDLILNNLLEQHKKVYGTSPDSNDRAFYKTQARQISTRSQQFEQGVQAGTFRRSSLFGGDLNAEQVAATRGRSSSELFAEKEIPSAVGKPQTSAETTLLNINRILEILGDPNTPKELKDALQAKLSSSQT